jgi:hypothetical protein
VTQLGKATSRPRNKDASITNTRPCPVQNARCGWRLECLRQTVTAAFSIWCSALAPESKRVAGGSTMPQPAAGRWRPGRGAGRSIAARGSLDLVQGGKQSVMTGLSGGSPEQKPTFM